MKKRLLSILLLSIIIVAPIRQAQSQTLWGMTWIGGINGNGAIFQTNLEGTLFNTVYSFANDTNAQDPFGSLIQANNGLLYGLAPGLGGR